MKINFDFLLSPEISMASRMKLTGTKFHSCRSRYLTKNLIFARFHGALLFALLLTSCAIGPDRLASSRLAYNEAVQITEQRELLLNIVRLRYHETPEFLAINGISSQFESSSTVGISSEFDGDGELTLLQPQAELGFAERPTITFTPQHGRDFTRQLLAPVGPETLYRLIEYGWGLGRIFGLAVRQINGAGTPIGLAREKFGSTPSPELREVISTLAEWQRRGRVTLNLLDQLEVVSPPVPADAFAASDLVDAAKEGYRVLSKANGYVLAKKAYRLSLHVDASFAQTAEWRSLARELDIDPEQQSYAIDPAEQRDQRIGNAPDTLYLATRSPLEIMAYLAQGVAVSVTDTQRREVASVEKSMASSFRIQTADDKPRNAYLAVPYRGRWFYMRADDLASRRSLGALISLLRLELQAGGAQNIPTLTLPVGQ